MHARTHARTLTYSLKERERVDHVTTSVSKRVRFQLDRPV